MKFCYHDHARFGEFEYVVHASISSTSCTRLAVRACANTRARTNKGAGGSEGTRARVDMAAPVAISGDRSDSGVAGRAGDNGRNHVFLLSMHILKKNDVIFVFLVV